MQRPSPRFRSEEYFVYEISEEMFYAVLVLTWMSSNIWRTETSRNICYRVLLQKREFILRGTHKH